MTNLFKFLFIVLPFFSPCLHGEDSSERKLIGSVQSKRIYFHLDNIHINEEGMFVLLEDGRTLALSQLSYDENGFYTNYSDRNILVCKNCSWRNRVTAKNCFNCGEPLK